MSSTVTIAVHVETFPLLSVTASVTLFGPTFTHVKSIPDVPLIVYNEIPQASEDPPSTSKGVIEAFPVASS